VNHLNDITHDMPDRDQRALSKYLEQVTWDPGTKILKHFEVTRKLGMGGHSSVFLVKNIVTGDLFAVKVPNIYLEPRSRRQRLFFREIRTWIDLPFHDNLTECYFFRSIDNRIAIFSEFVDGFSLDGLIVNQKIQEIKTILDIAIQMARGLAAAHDSGVIHQDVKPANVLISEDFRVKITDFGLSRAHELIQEDDTEPRTDGSEVSLSTGILTPAYCSLEQSARKKLDHRTDIWSFGLSVLTMFTGPPTWLTGAMGQGILKAYLKSPEQKGYPDLPDAICSLIKKCLQKSPADRWQTMDQISEELEKVYREITGNSYPRPRPEYRLKDFSEQSSQSLFSCQFDQIVSADDWLARAKRLDPAAIQDDSVTEIPDPQSVKARAVRDLEILDDALSCYSTAYLSGRDDLLAELIELMITISRTHRESGNTPGAINTAKESIDLIDTRFEQSLELRRKLIELYDFLGVLQHANHEPGEALKSYRKGLSLCEAVFPTDDETAVIIHAGIHLNLTALYGTTGDFNNAILASEAAVGLFDAFLEKRESQTIQLKRCSALINKANAFQQLGQLKESVDLFETCVRIMNEKMDTDDDEAIAQLARLHINKGLSLIHLGQLDLAEVEYDTGVILLENRLKQGYVEGLLPLLANAYENKSTVKFNRSQLDEGIQLLEKAITIREQLYRRDGRIEFAVTLSGSYINAGVYAEHSKRYEDAVLFHDKAISILEQCLKDSSQPAVRYKLANTYRNKAVSLTSLGQMDEALNHSQKALKMLHAMVYEVGLTQYLGEYAGFLRVKAFILYQMNRLSEARTVLEQALEIFRTEADRTNREELKTAVKNIEAELKEMDSSSTD